MYNNTFQLAIKNNHYAAEWEEILTAADLLQCGVDSSHRLQYVSFQEMRKVEWYTFLDSCTNTVCKLRRKGVMWPKQKSSFHI